MREPAVSQKLFTSRTERWQRRSLARLLKRQHCENAYGLGIGTFQASIGRDGPRRGQLLVQDAPGADIRAL